MATYYKPQSPIQSGGDFIYPLTTADQIILSDGSRLEKNGTIHANTTDTAINSEKLGGIVASSYALKTDTAPNSAELNGQTASYYATASALSSLTERVAALEAIPNANGVSY